MILYNKTTKKVITKKLKISKTFTDNLFGFLTEKNADAILFNTRFGIHTFFMKFPINIIILDKNNRVVKIKKDLNPNRLFFWNPKYSTIIEIKKLNQIKVNEYLLW